MKALGWAVVMVAAAGLGRARSQAWGDEPLAQQRAAAGAPVLVQVRSTVGSDLRFVAATLFLNGRQVARRTAPPGGELPRTLLLWSSADAASADAPPADPAVDGDGWLPIGEHAMTAELSFEGRAVGPFTYLDGYHYHMDANFSFTIAPNSRPVSIQLTADERAHSEIPDRDKVALGVQPGPGSGAIPALDPRGRSRPRR
jgi:hypothetical protein